MKLTVKDIQGNSQGELEVNLPALEKHKGLQAVHDVVVAHQAAKRSGTACTKTMGEVTGTGKKPWRQKGTGRARAGSFASPLWRGGGVVFGPKPRDFSLKVSKKTKQLALRKALTERLAAGDVVVVDDLKLASHKTKDLLAVLSILELDKTTLVVTTETDENLRRASRNLQNVQVTTSAFVHTYEILWPAKVLFTRSAFEQLEQRLQKQL